MQHNNERNAYAELITASMRSPEPALRRKQPELGQPMCAQCGEWPATVRSSDHTTPLCGACALAHYRGEL